VSLAAVQARARSLVWSSTATAKSFVTEKEKSLVFLDRPAHRHSVLSHAEWWNRRIAVEVEVVEVPRIKYRVPYITEGRAVPVIRSRLGNHIDLAARLSTVFRVIRALLTRYSSIAS